jgi:glucose-1-phosphate cytidylyltransferase
MVEVGGIPILVHIMRLYAVAGVREFVVALGYRGDIIKNYFVNYHLRNSDVTVQLGTGETRYHNPAVPDWTVHMADTGEDTMTGGRLKRLEKLLAPHGTFMLTYGDGVADIDVSRLFAFHREHGRLATITAVRPPGRFGAIHLDGHTVDEFKEKPQVGDGWINGGFFVFEPGVFSYIAGDQSVLEGEPLEALARDGQLMAYRHETFWHPMDTVRDRDLLNDLWAGNRAPWRRPER